MENWLNTEEALELLDPQIAIYLLVVIVILYLGKKVNDWLTPYDLNEQLTAVDNKAVAVSFGGYLFALGVIMWGVLGSPSEADMELGERAYLVRDLINTALWGGLGIVLLQGARIINDKLLLNQFSNMKELVEDKNVGTGVVQCGAYIGSAFMIRAAMSGEDEGGLAVALFATLLYFVIGQLLFILFSKLYQWVSRYDLHAEIEKDNVAAGLGFGMSMVAVGIVLSGYIVRYDSLVGLLLWFVISAFLLLTVRYMVDKTILPGGLLDDEISNDRNWGAAFVEGAAALGVALILNVAY